jgi:uncharacterized glyoxalase superfamily protein PhnB
MAEQELIDRFDEVVEEVRAHPERARVPAETELAALWRLAVDLVDLPNEGFRARLAADLGRRAESMKQATATPYIPAGFRSITPYVIVRGAGKFIDFIKQAFGASELDRTLSPDGLVLHAQLKLGDSVLELGEAGGFVPPMPSSIHYYVEDVDAVYASVLRAGATSLGEPSERPYGDRAAEVADPFGNHWFIATHVKDVRYR